MDDAQKVLDAAVARRTKIAELLVVEARAAVEEDRRNTLNLEANCSGLTQRGRGEHLFWIHTQSPPPDFGLSD
jgi:hypothetical protein